MSKTNNNKIEYEELRKSLRTIYYEESKSFTPEVMNTLSLAIWKAEQYDRTGDPASQKFLLTKEPDFEILGEFDSLDRAEANGKNLSDEYREEERHTCLSIFQRIRSYPPADIK